MNYIYLIYLYYHFTEFAGLDFTWPLQAVSVSAILYIYDYITNPDF